VSTDDGHGRNAVPAAHVYRVRAPRGRCSLTTEYSRMDKPIWWSQTSGGRSVGRYSSLVDSSHRVFLEWFTVESHRTRDACCVKYYVMRHSGESAAKPHIFLTSASAENSSLGSCSCQFTPRERASSPHWRGGWMSQCQFG
jgi:hypothetical protein